MSYINADERLPPDLIVELQKYVQGELLYIPCAKNQRLAWGLKNGTRARLETRNQEIRHKKTAGHTIDQLADSYALSPDAIRKILYRRERTG